MNADSVNKWLTLSANIGVVIGLILLLVEIDQNSDLVRAQIHQARADAQVSRMDGRSDSEHLVPALQKVRAAGGFHDLSSMDQLTQNEVARLSWYLRSRHTDYDNLFYQYQQGYLDEEYYQHTVVNSIARFAPWWEQLSIFDKIRRPSFDAEIKRILAAD